MSICKLLLLVVLVSTAFAHHSGYRWRHDDDDDDDRDHHHDHDDHDDDDYDDFDDDHDDKADRDKSRTVLIGAAGENRSRKVMWSGRSSYPGYRHPQRESARRPAVPPRTYLSRRDLWHCTTNNGLAIHATARASKNCAISCNDLVYRA
uniref:Expressed conserved protein n=1 Tax=Echinococcus granulosus TaxID=6210 RepID=A0A068WUA4_ECHGR|nr:expressed conserved protein [Echinococcus granulosus]